MDTCFLVNMLLIKDIPGVCGLAGGYARYMQRAGELYENWVGVE